MSRTPAPQDPDPRALSELELEVMQVVWDLGECTSGDVVRAFRSKRPLAASTLRNVLANLRGKGALEAVPTIGRGFRMRPTLTRESVARGRLRALLATLFEGSPREAIATLLDDAEVSESELQSIRDLIDERTRRATKKEEGR